MPQKIIKIAPSIARNCKIHPLLYKVFLSLKETMGAQIVHRRKRKSNICIEIIFLNDLLTCYRGSVNSLPEAEACGFWILCKPQSSKKHRYHKGYLVHLLYLSPVHPKKRLAIMPNITPLHAIPAQEALLA